MAVVGHDHGHAVARLDERTEAQVCPVEIHRRAHSAGATVDDARRTDPDTEEWRSIIGAERIDKVEEELEGGFAVTPFEGEVDRPQDLAAEVDDCAAESRLTEVKADQMTAVGGDA